MALNIRKEHMVPPENIDRRVRKTLEENKIGIWEWNLGSNVLYWNAVMFDLHGVQRHLFRGSPEIWDHCIHHEDLDKYKFQLTESIKKGGAFTLEYRCSLPDGGEAYLRTKAAVTDDDDKGKALTVSGICYDVTSFHLQEKNLTNFKEELEKRIAARTHDLQKAKQAALSLMQDADHQRNRAEKALEELTLSKRDLEKALYRAEEANLAKSNFLANMSHEIRTPLNAVIGMTYLVMNTDLDSKQAKHLSIVYDSARSLLEILNDILDYARLEACDLNIEETTFNLQSLLDETVPVFKKQLAGKGVELLVSRDELLPIIVQGDPLRIAQILRSLLSNAVKFTAKGKVEVYLRRLGSGSRFDGVEIVISDTGIGMEEKQTQKLFQRFLQLDGSTTKTSGGTGLGLTICSSLLDIMGGTIQVKSSPGQGTTFTVTLPLTEGIVSAASLYATPLLSLRGLRVLLLKQETTDQEDLERNLRALSFEVVRCTSLQEAKQLLQVTTEAKTPFELIIADSESLSPYSDIHTLQLNSKKMRQTALLILATSDHSSEMVRIFESRPITAIAQKKLARQQLLDVIQSLFGIPTDKAASGETDDAFVNSSPSSLQLEKLFHDSNKEKTVSDPEKCGLQVDLDVKAGLEKAHGNHALYDNLLRAFMNNAGQLICETAKSLHDNDLQATVRSIHQLKEYAEETGAVAFYDSCLDVEKYCTDGSGYDEKYFITLSELFELLEIKILDYLSSREAPGEPGGEAGSGDDGDGYSVLLLRDKIVELEHLLQKGDMEAESLYDEMKLILQQKYPNDVPLLETSMESLDFKQALSILHDLAVRPGN